MLFDSWFLIKKILLKFDKVENDYILKITQLN